MYSGHTKTRQSERCAAFQETVSDVTGFDFFQDWHAMYGASVVSFLQATGRPVGKHSVIFHVRSRSAPDVYT